MKFVKQAAKAVFAALVAGIGSLIAALTTGQSLTDLDAKTWLTVALATLLAGGGTYGIRNA